MPALSRARGERETAAPLRLRRARGRGRGARRACWSTRRRSGAPRAATPATYLGAWDALRKRFAASRSPSERGYTPGTFSFNVAGGRCEACKGEGAETVEMQFLADVRFSCPECGGKRFVGPVLDVRIDGKSVADVLEMTAAEARAHFASDSRTSCARSQPLIDVGLGYLRLGQPLSTLSGGEAQRLKLAAALAEVAAGSSDRARRADRGPARRGRRAAARRARSHSSRAADTVRRDRARHARRGARRPRDRSRSRRGRRGRHDRRATGAPEDVARSGASRTARAARATRSRRCRRRRAASAQRERALATSDAAMVVRARRARAQPKDVDVDIPRDKLVVVTGPSGSGKSTLAFDVVFAESQRRYLETLSPYVRQYLQQLPRPERGPRRGHAAGRVARAAHHARRRQNSTVATVTEVAHYLRLLYARAGLLHCPDCARADRAARRSTRCRRATSREALSAQARARCWRRSCAAGRARTASCSARARDERRARRRASTASCARARRRACRSTAIASTTSSSCSAGARAAASSCATLLERALREGKGSARVSLCDRGRAAALERARLPALRPRLSGARSALLLVQHEAGRVRALRGQRSTSTSARGRSAATTVSRVCAECNGTRLRRLALHTTIDGATITATCSRSSVDAARARVDEISLTGREPRSATLPLREIAMRGCASCSASGLGYLGLDRAA